MHQSSSSQQIHSSSSLLASFRAWPRIQRAWTKPVLSHWSVNKACCQKKSRQASQLNLRNSLWAVQREEARQITVDLGLSWANLTTLAVAMIVGSLPAAALAAQLPPAEIVAGQSAFSVPLLLLCQKVWSVLCPIVRPDLTAASYFRRAIYIVLLVDGRHILRLGNSRSEQQRAPSTAERAKEALRLSDRAHEAIKDSKFELVRHYVESLGALVQMHTWKGGNIPRGVPKFVAASRCTARCCSLSCNVMFYVDHQALECYTTITRQYGDLALANYARIGRSMALFQTGQKTNAILELEGLAYSLRGYAEVHPHLHYANANCTIHRIGLAEASQIPVAMSMCLVAICLSMPCQPDQIAASR